MNFSYIFICLDSHFPYPSTTETTELLLILARVFENSNFSNAVPNHLEYGEYFSLLEKQSFMSSLTILAHLICDQAHHQHLRISQQTLLLEKFLSTGMRANIARHHLDKN